MVVNKNDYLTLAEMKENAIYINQFLSQRGWTFNSICGMLGNMQTESTVNPGLWQNRDSGRWDLGFGLVQWTPTTKLRDWAVSEGKDYTHINTQLERLDYELQNNLQWITTQSYPISFQQFKTSKQTPEYLAQAFLRNYERPLNPNQPQRSNQARYWYDFLSDLGGAEVAQFPMDIINITQGENGSFSHMGTWCIDFVGTTTKYPYYAPCKVICRRVIQSSAVVIWSSVDEVLCADGSVRHITFSCIHEEPLWQTEGMILEKGMLMGHTGIGGHVTGDHLHLQVIEGDTYNGFTVNVEGANTLVGRELHIYDVFSTGGVNIVNGLGYDWKEITGGGGGGGGGETKDLIVLMITKSLFGGM